MRDPKIDPKQGDVLENTSGECRSVVELLDATPPGMGIALFQSVRFKSNDDLGTIYEVPLDEWQKWSADAEVLHQVDDQSDDDEK